jgi:hypothetical protein
MRGLSLSLLLVLTGCGPILKFDVEQDLQEQTVQGNILAGVLPSFLSSPFAITVDLKAETAKRGTGPVRRAYLRTFTLAITPHANPQGNFDFIDEVHMFVEAPGQTKAEVATLKPVPKSQKSLTFEVHEVDLVPYINAGATISATATGKQPAADTTFDGHIKIEAQI